MDINKKNSPIAAEIKEVGNISSLDLVPTKSGQPTIVFFLIE